MENSKEYDDACDVHIDGENMDTVDIVGWFRFGSDGLGLSIRSKWISLIAV